MSLQEIQLKLNAPKNQFNSFGKYNYRNQEDILEALKPILAPYKYFVLISDDIVQVGDRFYIKATVRLYDETMKVVAETTAFAREPLSRKGMVEAQCTGSTSSYARKYALNGMFLIDDNKDPDNSNNSNNTEPPKKISTDQLTEILDLMDETKSDVDQFNKFFKIKKTSELPVNSYNQAKTMLKKKVKK